MHELDAFRQEVDRSLAVGRFAEIELEVVDVEGRSPVVVALEDERLPVLLRRIEAVGGFANVFVKTRDGVRRVSVMDVDGALDVRGADDMRREGDQPSADSSVGVFVDYLAARTAGVVLPARLASASKNALPARQVEIIRSA
ncbi:MULTISPECIES: hypothetical protein [unclassified Curtobacterium]|uniref:hypothetical protein n=1 Tax=unclassified Curtobacterium TaxID=257496 RepID=UPI00277F2918|nr:MULTISPECIES: hypothetical protein [unclassified Curtobacterium]MDP9735050.1 hypothetical protein [Curtobacterium sp. 260]MDT0210946.1 hypothetical protein [Curtobacterium sp. BRD11]